MVLIDHAYYLVETEVSNVKGTVKYVLDLSLLHILKLPTLPLVYLHVVAVSLNT